MSREELLDRIKSEVILREGEIREHEWKQIGLLDEAIASNVPERDFFQLVQDVSRKVDSDLPRINSLSTKIKEAAERSNRQLTEEDLKQFVGEAERLQLPRTFVEKKWIPQIVSTIPVTAVEKAPSEEIQPVPNSRPVRPAPSIQNRKPASRPIETKPEQAGATERGRAVPNTFRGSPPSIDYNPGQAYDLVRKPTLKHTVNTLLGPVGATLYNVDLWRRLLNKSLKWSGIFLGLVWKVLAFITVSFFNAILAFGRLLGRAEFWRATASIVRVAIVAGIVWALWSWYKDKVSKSASRPTNVATAISTKVLKHPKKHKKGKSHSINYPLASTNAGAVIPGSSQPNMDEKGRSNRTNASDSSLSVAQSNQSDWTVVTSKQYDNILDRVGQFGERPAAIDGKWGLWVDGRWLIQPEYDEIDVFKNNVATVRLNGQQFNIGRRGTQIREED